MPTLCSTVHDLFEGRWLDWHECFFPSKAGAPPLQTYYSNHETINGQQCCVSSNRSEAPWLHPSIAMHALPTPTPFYSTTPFAPRAWAPHGCSLELFDSTAARQCLSRRPLLLVGDSTSNGVYDELLWVLEDYKEQLSHDDRLGFLRLDSFANVNQTAKMIFLKARSMKAEAIVINTGPHAAKRESVAAFASCAGAAARFNGSRWFRRVGHASSWFTDTDRPVERFVTQLVEPDAWRDALKHQGRISHGTACDELVGHIVRNATDHVIALFAALRTAGFAERLFWRNVLINLGFDHSANAETTGAGSAYRPIMNHIAVRMNARMRSMSAALAHSPGFEIFDNEEFSAARPETFYHENTFHAFCICPNCEEATAQHPNCTSKTGGDIRFRCKTKRCEQLRSSYYDNGEPNRYLTQLHLHAICRLYSS